MKGLRSHKPLHYVSPPPNFVQEQIPGPAEPNFGLACEGVGYVGDDDVYIGALAHLVIIVKERLSQQLCLPPLTTQSFPFLFPIMPELNKLVETAGTMSSLLVSGRIIPLS